MYAGKRIKKILEKLGIKDSSFSSTINTSRAKSSKVFSSSAVGGSMTCSNAATVFAIICNFLLFCDVKS